MKQLKLRDSWTIDLGFSQATYNILCAIWNICLILEQVWALFFRVLSDMRILAHFMFSFAPQAVLPPPWATALPFDLHPSRFASSFFFFFSASLPFFLSPLFPLPSLVYNVPCLDFNGMCSREAPQSSITRHPESFLETRQDDSSPGLKWIKQSRGKKVLM